MIHEDLAGWLSDAEFHELRRLATGRTVLEIGSWCGRSTVAMAATAKTVYCADHFRGDAYTGAPPADLFGVFRANVERCGVADRVFPLVGDQRAILPVLDARRFDLIFYDADHSGEATRFALDWIADALPVFRKPQASPLTYFPIVAVHDYSDAYESYRDAKCAIDDFAARTGRRLRLVNVLAVLEPMARQSFMR